MALRIISADERLAQLQQKTSVVIVGPPKIGKTSLLWTMDPATTLAIDIEAGLKSVQGWKGDSVSVRTYREAADIACLAGGPNPALRSNDMFSAEHYNAVVASYGAAINMARYKTTFWDSITDLTRLAGQYAREVTPLGKTGLEDTRGQFGTLGRETIGLLKHVQFGSAANTIFVGILEKTTDEFGRVVYQPQMEGAMAARQLPGIVDHVVSMVLLDFAPDGPALNFEAGAHRVIVCHRLNPWGLPAGTRSAHLDMLEEPHLGKLIAKINQHGGPADTRLAYTTPAAAK